MNNTIKFIAAGLLAALFTLGNTVHAAEGGGSNYANGNESFMVGALPPPGFYSLNYFETYSANRLNDGSGHNLHVPGFSVNVNALVPRFVWVTDVKVLGGNLAFHTILPLVNINASATGASQTKYGFGDMTVGAGVGFHHSPHFSSVVGMDFILPTGSYTKTDLANIGRNYTTIEPVYALNYTNPDGFNGDIRLGYLINKRNDATDYISGNEFHIEYAAGWGLGHGWTAGIGGYLRQQINLDQQYGVNLPDSKTSAFAIGPTAKYDSGKGWFVTARWDFETYVKNGPQGNALWIKAVVPL